jgi:hypothetical protein
MPLESILSKLRLTRLMPHIIELSLIGAGVILLAWVSSLVWTDVSQWGKDIGAALFGSRQATEPISLGIGMTVFNYLLISIALIGTGGVLFLRNHILTAKPVVTKPIRAPQVKTPVRTAPVKTTTPQQTTINTPQHSEVKPTLKEDSAAAQEERFFSGCLHHFGYLSSRPKESPIPQECILCQRLGDCMVATVYVNKLSD